MAYDHKEQQEKQQPTESAASDDSDYDDDSDDGDDAHDMSHDSFTERCSCSEGTGVHHVQESISVCEDVAERQQEHDQRDPTDILRNQRHHVIT